MVKFDGENEHNNISCILYNEYHDMSDSCIKLQRQKLASQKLT